jgi:uncharacterized phage protein gp47/JayE
MTPTPTTQQLNDQIITDLAGALEQTIPILPKSFLRVLARVLAAVAVLLFKYAGFLALQIFVAHATYELTTFLGQKVRPLEMWGLLIGAGPKRAATAGEFTVTLTVLATGELKAGTKLVRSETGVIYEVAFSRTVSDTSFNATIRPISDQKGGDGSGTIGNLAVGDKVSFANSPPFVGSEATVSAILKTGADAETVEAYRARIILRFQRKPQGGAYADYQAWGEEAEGIARVYPYTGLPGEVELFVESETEPDGIPTSDQLTAVWYAVHYEPDGTNSGIANRRPITAAINVRKISRTLIDVTVIGLSPNTPENQTAISDGLAELFYSKEPFIEGLSTLPRNDRITAAEAGGLVNGIVDSLGATVNSVSLSSGVAITLSQGEKAKLGTPTFG